MTADSAAEASVRIVTLINTIAAMKYVAAFAFEEINLADTFAETVLGYLQ